LDVFTGVLSAILPWTHSVYFLWWHCNPPQHLWNLVWWWTNWTIPFLEY